ncbi:MAG: AAA family ATPase [Candidatus Aminicenantes bacterium]|nr:AAA family ATPase [Candidatus Aminicenantes bacterium]
MTEHYDNIKPKPVIFLAFANDPRSYLRKLPDELRSIRDTLKKSAGKISFDVVERANATIDDILDVFQEKKYRDRVAVFYYGGHAEKRSLLLENLEGFTSPAYREGFVPFLARQKSLQLVFLNGCKTKDYAAELVQVGIPAAVGSTHEIDDQAASKLAIRFFNGLANDLPLEQSWQEAGDHIKSLDITLSLDDHGQENKECFPWVIFYKDDSNAIKKWKLSDAANDPFFSLPPLPPDYHLPDKPFLFLERFRKQHAGIFFGRSNYIRELYSLIKGKGSPPIILLHGQSGVGKSSLLEAGLLPRLEQSHTTLYLQRNREKGLTAALENALDEHISSSKENIYPEGSLLKEKWQAIETYHSKPLLVVLDQVEQVYTDVNEELPGELEDFLSALETLFKNPETLPGGKLILGYRKEYHPEIDDLCKLHELKCASLFLKPLQKSEIEEVIAGLTLTQRLVDKYRLSVEARLPARIADYLSTQQGNPIAPTLQITMTKMWQEAKKNGRSACEFTVEHFENLRRNGLLMEDFFKQQMARLKERKEEAVASGLALSILFFFTTSLGTAAPRDISTIQQAYGHLNREIIENLVKHLKDLYLLAAYRDSKHQFILAHDTLAPIVIKEYNESDKPGQRAARVLAAKMEDFRREGDRIWLDEPDLKIVEQGKNGMRFVDSDGEKLLEISRKQKARQEKLKKRIKRTGIFLIFTIIIIAIFALYKAIEANHEAKIAEANYFTALARLKLDKNDPVTAIRCAEKAYYLHKTKENMQVLSAAAATTSERPFYSAEMRHKHAVNHVEFSPDGRTILTASSDKTAVLRDINGKPIVTLPHDSVVYSARFSSRGSEILTHSRENTARLWDLQGNCLTSFQHEDIVSSARFSPDGRWVLTASEDFTAKLWSLRGNPEAAFTGHTDMLNSAVFSPGGSEILTASRDKTAKLYDLDGNMLTAYRHRDSVTTALFTPDGQAVLTASRIDNLNLWNLKGEIVTGFHQHKDMVNCTRFSADGRQLFTAYHGGAVVLWNTGGALITTFDKHKAPVYAAVFSPGGKKILTASEDNSAKLWDMKGNVLADLNKHKKAVTHAAFSPGGSKILTASRDNTAKLWDLHDQPAKELNFRRIGVSTALFSPKGSRVLIVSDDKVLHLSDLHGNITATISGHKKIINTAAFSPDGAKILTASADKTAKLWNINGDHLKDFSKHTANVNSAAFSPDGTKILTASFDGTAKLWDLQGSLLVNLDQHTAAVTSALFSPGGDKILTASYDKTAKLWDLNGKLLLNLRPHSFPVTYAEFSSGGAKVLTVSVIVRLWDIESHRMIELERPTGPEHKTGVQDRSINAAHFSPDGQKIVTASNDNTVQLWSLEGDLLVQFDAHKTIIYSAVFSPGGRRLLTASADKTVKLWDLQGNMLADFDQHEGVIRSAVFSPDGRRVLSAAADSTVKLWLTPEAIIEWLKTAKIPPLPRGKI